MKKLFRTSPKKNLSFFAFSIFLAFYSCKDAYKKTENGLEYKFYKKSEQQKKPKEGDVITLSVVYKTQKDSVFFDSKKMGNAYRVLLQKPTYKGSIEEGLAMMSEGDSASFKLSADSFFIKTAQQSELPTFIQKGSTLIFDVKLEKIQTREEVEKEMTALMEKMQKEEETNLNAYITQQSITQKPTASGLYYIEKTKGKGAKAENRNPVAVHYTGTLLNGTKFDSSHDRGEPFEFVLGTGQVIPGWDEGISMMQEGGTATLIVPSHLAYGAMQQGPVIAPYSTLVFEVELVKVK